MLTTIIRVSFPLIISILLSACSGGGKDTETRFYLLSPLPVNTPPLTTKPNLTPLKISLTPITLPQYLERPQIVVRASPNRLEINEFDNWGGSLEKNMTRTLSANLSMLLETPDIQITSIGRTSGHDVHVDLQVLQFERGPDRRAVLNARWRLYGPGRNQTPKSIQLTRLSSDPIQIPAPKAVIDHSADVAAMSQLLGELSQIIAQAIVKMRGI